MAKKWIQEAITHPGALKKTLGVSKKTGRIPIKKISTAAKMPGVTGKRANLALTLRKISKGK
jgi:hypothetical protein